MNKILGSLFVGSSLSLAAYTYKSIEGKSAMDEVNTILSCDPNNGNNHIKPNELDKKSLYSKQMTPNLRKSIDESKILINRFMSIKSIPGLSIAISHRGDLLWSRGFGFANLEQGSKCQDTTVMRIASISKPMTMLLVAKLVEDGKLDLDEPIYTYLKDKFPHKSWNGKQVNITLRQLTSHTSGIRSYKMPASDDSADNHDGLSPEFYIRDHYKDVFESLKIFKDDDLIYEPGSKFHYTTLAWTLISAVVESVLDQGDSFGKYWTRLLNQQLGLRDTSLDMNDKLILNRSNYYSLSKSSKVLMNSPSVDNSHKWAGGGLVSTALDVNRFGNVMLFSFLGGREHAIYGKLEGYLKRSTVKQLWTPVPITCKETSCAGLGWFVASPDLVKKNSLTGIEPQFNDIAFHTGAAVGASSVLLILPDEQIVISILCNLQEVSLHQLAKDVVKVFLRQIKS